MNMGFDKDKGLVQDSGPVMDRGQGFGVSDDGDNVFRGATAPLETAPLETVPLEMVPLEMVDVDICDFEIQDPGSLDEEVHDAAPCMP